MLHPSTIQICLQSLIISSFYYKHKWTHTCIGTSTILIYIIACMKHIKEIKVIVYFQYSLLALSNTKLVSMNSLCSNLNVTSTSWKLAQHWVKQAINRKQYQWKMSTMNICFVQAILHIYMFISNKKNFNIYC